MAGVGDNMAADIGKAVVSVLSKYQAQGQALAQSDDDDFITPRPKKSKRQCSSGMSSNSTPRVLPTSFLGRRSRGAPNRKVEKITTYNRDIICLPECYRWSSKSNTIKIPRDRSALSRSGLIGKITLLSSMTQEEIFDEIRSVFRVPMGGSDTFSFDVLQPTGGKSKGLTIPALSPNYQWTASSIVPKNAKVPLYVLAKEPLGNESDEEDSDNAPLIDLTKETMQGKKDVHLPKKKSVLEKDIHLPKKDDPYSVYESIIDDDPGWSYSPTPPPVSPLTPADVDDSLSLSDVICEHRLVYLPIDREDRVRIPIRRKHIFDDMLHKLRCGLNTSKYIKITFLGEPGVDDGGPLREFLYLLMQAVVKKNSLFCGPPTARVPRHNVMEENKRSFYYVGVMLALTIIHGGPAPQFFAPAIADYIVKGIQGVKLTVDDVPDPTIRTSLQELQDTNSEEEFHHLLAQDAYDYRFDIGVAQPVKSISFSGKFELISCVCKHFAIHQVKSELDQMLCGLSETLHCLDMIRINSALFRPLFIYFERPPFTSEEMFDLIVPTYSVAGSNAREKEEGVTMLWIDYLQHIQAGSGSVVVKENTFKITFADILAFTTGMPVVPPIGFSPSPSLKFTTKPFPNANACINLIYVPLQHTCFSDFAWHMCFGILNSAGFGRI